MRLIIHDYGGYAFTVQCGRVLAKNGHNVHYVYSDTTQNVKRGLFESLPGDPPGLSFQGIRLSHPFEKYSFLKRRSQEIEHGRFLAEEIEKFRPEVVISADTPLDAQVEALKACRKVEGKFVFWLQDLIGIATGKILQRKIPVFGRLIGYYYGSLEKKILRQSDAIISIAEDFRPILNAWHIPLNKVSVIPNWAPIDEIVVGEKNNRWVRSMGLENRFNFLYAGILGLKHNPELLLQLADQLRQYSDALVVVVSEGPGADWLKKKAEEQKLGNLKVLNFQPKECFSDMLAGADVLVAILGSDAGKFSIPSKVLSYLCAGRPLLLAVPLDNLAARIVLEVQAGVVVAPDDLPGFNSAARKLIERSDLRDIFGKNARRYAETHFDIDQITKQFEEILNQI